MNSDTDHNPFSSSEISQQCDQLMPDRIGDSVYSKHWLLQVLIAITESINKESKSSTAEVSSVTSQDREENIIELEPELEESSCTLWDMSVNSDVAHFLHESNVSEIFLEVIDKTHSPRLLEIIAGILGNMMSFDDICCNISSKSSFVKFMINLTGSSDVPTLIQVLRLIRTGIANENSKRLWLSVLQENSFFLENLKFIMENSLNCIVLKAALQILYYVLDQNDASCLEWGDDTHIKALITAGEQIISSAEYESLDELWLVLNLLSQQEKNVKNLCQYFETINSQFRLYFTNFVEHENALPPPNRIPALAASCSICAVLLNSTGQKCSTFINDSEFLKTFQSMCLSLEHIAEMNTLSQQKLLTEAGDHIDKNIHSGNNISPSPPKGNSENDEFNTPNVQVSEKMENLQEVDCASYNILKDAITELCYVIQPLLPLSNT